MEASSSSGFAAGREELLECFLKGSSSPDNLSLFFFFIREGS
jgi:hypothetical protein